MSPKEKAEELIEKFSKSTLIFYDRVGSSEVKYEAKRCALIAVDEILLAITYADYGLDYLNQVSYWIEVKQEIEKL